MSLSTFLCIVMAINLSMFFLPMCSVCPFPNKVIMHYSYRYLHCLIQFIDIMWKCTTIIIITVTVYPSLAYATSHSLLPGGLLGSSLYYEGVFISCKDVSDKHMVSHRVYYICRCHLCIISFCTWQSLWLFSWSWWFTGMVIATCNIDTLCITSCYIWYLPSPHPSFSSVWVVSVNIQTFTLLLRLQGCAGGTAC